MRLLFALTLILPCLAPPAAASDQLGRLFLTPQQRQDLDRRRATNRAEEEAPPQAKEGPLTVNGHIQRSGGKTATWINGAPEYDSHASRDPTQITVAPNPGEPGVRLKIGQTLDRSTGEVRDNLQDGEIRIEKKAVPATARNKR